MTLPGKGRGALGWQGIEQYCQLDGYGCIASIWSRCRKHAQWHRQAWPQMDLVIHLCQQ